MHILCLPKTVLFCLICLRKRLHQKISWATIFFDRSSILIVLNYSFLQPLDKHLKAGTKQENYIKNYYRARIVKHMFSTS